MTGEANKIESRIPKRSFSTEFWVGFFAIIGVGCFAYLSINIGGMRLSSSGYYKVIAEFDNISGLKLGAPVEIAGVEVGTVAAISLNSTTAIVTLEILKGVKIRDDDIAAIRTKGIIGDKFVKIAPGASSNTLKDGSRVTDTESAVEFEEIIGKFIHSLE